MGTGVSCSIICSGREAAPTLFDFLSLEAVRNEDDPRSAVVVCAGVQKHRRMKNMMNAVNRNRRILSCEIENAFHAQQILAT
jgi:hypothetical protein